MLRSTAKPLDGFKSKLNKFLKRKQILDDDVDLKLYDTDATSLFKDRPGMVLIPYSTEEVAKIVQTINQYNSSIKDCSEKLGFVARGAGTGLSGGAIGGKHSIIISLAKLDKLLAYDEVNQVALIETGLVNSALSNIVQHTGLHFSPDPSSEDACTIGGNIAENAGGIHCYKHGVTSEQILGLEVVMPNGDIEYFGQINIGACNGVSSDLISAPKSNLDIAKLFVGSEGTFGIATKALVKLQPIPESFLTMQICFTNVDDAARVVAAIVKQGIKPTAIEMIDEGAIEAVSQAFELGLTPNTKAVLLIELDGDNDEVLLEAKQIKELIEDPAKEFNPIQYTETQDPEKRKFLWKVRKGTVAAYGKIAPYWYLYDTVVPRSKIPEALKAINEISAKHNLKLASVLHAADGNLHPNFLYDPDKDPQVIERVHKASHEIMQLCIDLGGVLSGEHGIGVEKQDYMPFLFSDNDMATMLKVRRVFDPEMVSNPGKIFPVRVCKEF